MMSVSPRTSWLTTALLRMHLARAANASVDAVSEPCSCAGLTFAMISVFALPPRDSCAVYTCQQPVSLQLAERFPLSESWQWSSRLGVERE